MRIQRDATRACSYSGITRWLVRLAVSQVPAQRAVLMEVCGVVALFRNQTSNRGGQGVWRDV